MSLAIQADVLARPKPAASRPGGLALRSRADGARYRKAAQVIEQAAWSDLGFLLYTRAHYEHYAAVLDRYADFQLCLIDEDAGYPVAASCAAPLRAPPLDELPEEGWDWEVETAAAGRLEDANMLGALAISVPAMQRSRGFAKVMIKAMLELAAERGLDGLVAPVRPSAKAGHPHVPIAEYVTWKDARGRVYDPWLRSHLASGGRLIKPCARSMVVEEPLAFWETWANRPFERSGDYVLPGALAPVAIDLDRKLGRYEEPNIWVAYEL